MPLGLLRLTSLPMGAMNSVQILQGDISFILQDEMPGVAAAFMDDINIKGPSTRYETTEDRWYTSSAFADPPVQSRLVSCASGPDGLWLDCVSGEPFHRACVVPGLGDRDCTAADEC